MAAGGRTLPWDWYPGTIPDNVEIGEGTYIETSYSFHECRSEADPAVRMGRGSQVYLAMMFDLGERGRVCLGDYSSITGGRVICDHEIIIGNCCLISWNVVIMDTYRLPADVATRRSLLEQVARTTERAIPSAYENPLPVRIEDNVWIGFDSCVLPGVRIGEGSIVAAKSVVIADVPPFTIVGGNPARIIRTLDADH